MSVFRHRIETRLRERISDQWRARNPDGVSGPPEHFFQPLMTRLDEVIEIISGIRDYSLEPYQDRVRQIVCSTCRADPTGACTRRDEQDCALDAYFPQIVAIIEDELRQDPGFG